MPLLVSYVNCLCVTGIANIINVPYTWVYRRLFFLHYPSGGDCKHPEFLCLACPTFFDDAKRGKIGMTVVVLVWLGLSSFLKNFSLLWLDYFGTNLFLPFNVNMVIWFVIIKKGEFVDHILILCKVLMKTNTNVIYT